VKIWWIFSRHVTQLESSSCSIFIIPKSFSGSNLMDLTIIGRIVLPSGVRLAGVNQLALAIVLTGGIRPLCADPLSGA
jgi:hypothetical protein